jgi:hypothetical protein
MMYLGERRAHRYFANLGNEYSHVKQREGVVRCDSTTLPVHSNVGSCGDGKPVVDRAPV